MIRHGTSYRGSVSVPRDERRGPIETKKLSVRWLLASSACAGCSLPSLAVATIIIGDSSHPIVIGWSLLNIGNSRIFPTLLDSVILLPYEIR